MTDAAPFGLAVLVAAAALLAAVASNALTERIRVPAPALFLALAALASDLVPALGRVPLTTDERVVTVALVFILFDGGRHIGWRRFRVAAGPIVWVAVAGTVLTAAAVALVAVLLLGLAWPTALLLGAALSPTDPAVVFSVLGRRDIAGRSGTILEGESGVNDPVGIALLVSLLAVSGSAGSPASAVLDGLGEFALQMGVGAAVGVVGGLGLAQLLRRVRLPNAALHPVLTIACAGVIYGAGAALHGSGFLAVFLAGIFVGDVRGPYKIESDRFTAGFANLAEVVTFTVLGLSVSWSSVLRPEVLLPALGIAALLILVIRPLLVGLLLIPVRLDAGERVFVLWAGLKGAVPILLGMLVLGAGVPDARRVYDVIFVVVLVSVVVQGGLVPTIADRLRVPMRVVDPEPYAAGMRFQEEPVGLERHVVAPGSVADGTSVGELTRGHDGWISMIRRDGRQVRVATGTRLEPGDEVLTFTDDDRRLAALFEPGD